MTKTILITVSALAISAGTAFAAIGDYEPAAPAVDHSTTVSISDGQNVDASVEIKIPGSDRSAFGR